MAEAYIVAAVLSEVAARSEADPARIDDRGLRCGLQTMCEGGGVANVTIVEAV